MRLHSRLGVGSLLCLILPLVLGEQLPPEEEQCAERTAEARGIFPRGCKWRDITGDGQVLRHEYWDAAAQAWVSEQPAACWVQGVKGGDDYAFQADGKPPATLVDCAKAHCIYKNLWYNNGRWYALVDTTDSKSISSFKMSRNQEVISLHQRNMTAWVGAVDWRAIPGDSLAFDFNFFLHPTAIGHWGEMLFPLYSVFKTLKNFARPPTQIILMHLKRQHLMEWVRAVAAVAFGVKPGEELPPIMLQRETSNIWHQITSPLEGYPPTEWLVFERVLMIKDLYTGGGRTFLHTLDAQAFREELYHEYGLASPRPWQPHEPRPITFQVKAANRRVVNQAELEALLRSYGELTVVEFSSDTSFHTQLKTMSETGLYVSVHTSNLANSPFLPPGSIVFEIIQRHWNWNGLDKSFKDQTSMMGDLHHFAWRCLHRNQTVYLNPRDVERFGDWTNKECLTEECVEAHTNVDVIVDIPQIKKLLDKQLPRIIGGLTPNESAIPWPAVK